MLTLELELLTGVYRAALPDGTGAEWPPHPERVFSALVQAWSDGGEDPEEEVALKWLEQQSVPMIEASPRTDEQGDVRVSQRDAPIVFVPPNDPRGTELQALPTHRKRQPRTFEASVPDRALVRMQWTAQPDAAATQALGALAHRVASLGHSSSLVRALFRTDDIPLDPGRTWLPTEHGSDPLRAPYEGRFDDLRRWHATGGGKKAERPRSLRFVRFSSTWPSDGDRDVPQSAFGGPNDWFVFEHDDGFRPDLLAIAVVAHKMRCALMKHGPQPPCEIVSGHRADGSPSQRPHMAVVPLANLGWTRADGELMGIGVVLPRALPPEERHETLRGIVAALKVEEGRAHLGLDFGDARRWQLSRSPSPSRASLRPERWCRVSRCWASATPVLLDRFPDGDDPIEEARIIAAACRNIGLPEPERIEIHKHAAIRAAPSAYPARRTRSLPDWRFPHGSKIAARPRRHVVVEFGEGVRGPVILGAGRYVGLGLCLPLEMER